MKLRKRIESKGYKITVSISNFGEKYIVASEHNGFRKITGTSITDLHRKIFGYV